MVGAETSRRTGWGCQKSCKKWYVNVVDAMSKWTEQRGPLVFISQIEVFCLLASLMIANCHFDLTFFAWFALLCNHVCAQDTWVVKGPKQLSPLLRKHKKLREE